MSIAFVTTGLLLQTLYWTVVGGFGVLAIIMGYLLLPSRLQVLGVPTVRSGSSRPPRRDDGSLFAKPTAERTVEPVREAHDRIELRSFPAVAEGDGERDGDDGPGDVDEVRVPADPPDA